MLIRSLIVVGAVIHGSVSFAAVTGDYFSQIVDCNRVDAGENKSLPVAFDLYAPSRGNKGSSSDMFLVEKYGAKHQRVKHAVLAASQQILENGAPMIEIEPVAMRAHKLVFSSHAIHEGKPFRAKLVTISHNASVAIYDCELPSSP